MFKAILAALTDPGALVLALVVGLAAGGYGYVQGAAAEAALCQAAQLRKDLAAVTAERDTLKGRLDTINRLAEADAARAAADAKADKQNQETVRATPLRNGACLDAAAARRLRSVR
ncbi:hypothetical protein [Xanthobacter sp. KR7-225]|uniref:hypothetical protein n=1 Tax=Xanthobacter sp. KR7-225 TaxID=3156613 RepID=UPI0032B3A5C8